MAATGRLASRVQELHKGQAGADWSIQPCRDACGRRCWCGKSRLVATAAASVSPEVLVVSGWCLRLSDSVPFLSVVDVLRELEEVDDGRLLAAVLDNCQPFVRTELARLMPTGQEQQVESRTADDLWRRQRLFEALRRVFAALPQMRPVAIVIEDGTGPTRQPWSYLTICCRPDIRPPLRSC
jgi:AAA ATPase domain